MKNNPSILDVFNWYKNEEVDLPQVQRGFVWRPHQIENLWDSLLRGYPIGSFIFASKSEQMLKPSLLDGQQRATSICLGFNNLEDTEKIFNANGIGVFLDLKKPSNKDTRKFIFRVITKSHPWGYQREDNRKTLDRLNIERAKGYYGLKEDEKFYEKELCHFWPYDTTIPLPLNLFLDAHIQNKSIDDLKDKIRDFVHKLNGTKELDSREALMKRLDIILAGADQESLDQYYSIEFICSQVKELVSRSLPLSMLDLDYSDENKLLESDGERFDEVSMVADDNEDDMDDIENLFVRLNSAGTPLRGEELNYSILKAVLKRSTQTAIEEKCHGFINPARFITISFRLFQHLKEPKNASVIMRIKPKDFQKNVRQRKDIEEYEKCIVDDLLPLLDKTKTILTFDKEENPKGLPSFLVHRISDSAPEIIFMLMYRLLIKGDRITLRTAMHTRVLGLVTYFAWFGKGIKLKNHEPLMRNISKFMIGSNAEDFWSHQTVSFGRLNYRDQIVLFPILSKSRVRRYVNVIIEKNQSKIDNGSFANISTFDKGNVEFYRKTFFEKSFLVYAQKEYFDHKFPKAEMYLDDTNVPFDWDHISPQALINKTGTYQSLKDWYSSNGNFRALSYSENRSKSDNSPADSLDPQTSWIHFRCKYKDWKHHDFERKDMKNTECQKMIFKLIMERNLDLYTNWLEELEISELLKDEDPAIVLDPMWKMLNQNKWDFDRKNQLFILKFDDMKSEIYFEFENEEGGALGEENAQFGIYMRDKDKLQEAVLKGRGKVDKSSDNKGYIVYERLTLNGFREEDFISFFKQFLKFIACFKPEFSEKVLISFIEGFAPGFEKNFLPESEKEKITA